eukprot:GEZU01015943.1.p1 GENE.GEZU01015943.1~~GEZU01015943.1.p1  ORF type:complete len:213 (+),score=75.60 GEZU01015943.1:166-804(+)
MTSANISNNNNLNDLPSEIKQEVTQFEAAVSDIEAHLKPLFAMNLAQASEDMGPIDRAKLNLAMAYTVNTLFFMYLRAQGVNPQDHPVKDELERVKKYMNKIKEVQESLTAKQTLRLNKDAANRFIQAAIPEANIVKRQKRSKEAGDDESKENQQVQIESESQTKDKSKKRRKDIEAASEQQQQQVNGSSGAGGEKGNKKNNKNKDKKKSKK